MLDYDIRLEAERINGSNDWIDIGNFIRKTGESGNYRVFYTFSSTEVGVFNNVVITVALNDDVYHNINNFYSVIVPIGASYTTELNGNQHLLVINMGSGLPAGQTGFIEFSVNSFEYTGPDGEIIPSTASLEGSFLNDLGGDEEQFFEEIAGPNWQVQAENLYEYAKTVTVNGNVVTPENEAYFIEYLIKKTSPTLVTTGIGSWKVESASFTDTLPIVAGAIPEVVYSSQNPYTVTANVISWNAIPDDNVRIGVRYPKEAIDAIGGLEEVGEITNSADIEFILLGGIVSTKHVEVTHDIKPIPTEIIGNIVAKKEVVRPNPFPGYGLHYAPGNVRFEFETVLANSNVIPDQMILTDEEIRLNYTDGTSEVLVGPNYWNTFYSSTPGGRFEYNTNLNPVFQIAPGVTFPNPLTQVIPASTPTNFMDQWRLIMTDFTRSNQSVITKTGIILAQRAFNEKIIKELINTATLEVVLPDGSRLEETFTCVLPFDYEQKVVWAIRQLTSNDTPIANLGSTIRVDIVTRFNLETSVDVLGTDLFFIIPSEIIFISGNEAATVTENWNGTTNTLVHVHRPETVKALIDTFVVSFFDFLVSPTAALGEYEIQAYYVINQEQASNPEIIMQPYDGVAPDIYDLDGNGNTSQLVPYKKLNITVAASNVVNVLKMSKSFQDSGFQVNNDTQITRRELFQYKFFVRNDSLEDLLYLTIIDIFPYVGDVFGSQWSPVLAQIPDVQDYVTLSYSQVTNPSLEPIESVGVNDWTVIPPADLSTVKALKFDFGDHVFAPGESAEIILTMFAADDAPDLSLAYNSVRYIASARDADGVITQYLPAFSPPAYARLTFRSFDTFVGDFVWWDLNSNGLQDVDEPGINGVKVELLDDDLVTVYESETTNHPITGLPGYYAFENIWPARYIAKFLIELADGKTLTLMGEEMRGNNSVADPMTGLSEVFTVIEGAIVDTIDAGYVTGIVPFLTIGDFVWHDLNKNGIQDPGEPGINGVLVELIDNSDATVSSTITVDNPITGEPGYYEFAGVPFGIYSVLFPTELPNGDTLTIKNAGSDPNINSKPDPQNGLTDSFVAEINLEEILNIDAGYISPEPAEPATIGDYVWEDLNRNGIQDPGEPGLNGITINLFDDTGQLVGNTTTQNSPLDGLPGYYELTVPPGIYYLEFPTELSDGKVLTIKDAGTDPAINSKADPNTGRTDLFTVVSGELITNIDAGYITPLIELSIIGDYVWDDLNGNGIQDPGEPGINGVLVNLYNSTGVLIESVRTEDNPATGLPGFYEFTVPAGSYFVEFPILLENGQQITIQNAGVDPEINSKADPNTGRTDLFTVAAGASITNIDAGYIELPIQSATIGDYVWQDLNRNGIQDPGEPGLNGVAITVFDNTGQLIGTTITQNNPLDGLPGYYELTVSPGIYYLEFPTELSNGENLTIKDAGTDPAINSKADPNTGRTDLITIASGELITNIDAGYITPLIELSIIGDYVWQDLNRNGIQDAGEPGINGVLVNLYNSTGVLIESVRTEDNPATGLPGFYEFTVPAGSYFVEFPILLENGQQITIQNAGIDPAINSKADPSTGRTNLFSVAPGQIISNIDAGYIEPPVQLAIIGDYVWDDLNRNGIQDPGEPGLNGVTINLFDNTGELIGHTTTQNNPLDGLPGYYELTVSPGLYYLEFPTELSDGKVLTIKDAGVNPEINSKADPNTGRTDLIAVTSGELITNIDAGYITPLIELSMIGNYVWEDLNRNGIQDAGEPGINGVLVNLYNSTGVLIESIRTEDNPATGLPGFYEFTVPAGVYFVEFPIRLENGQEITIQNAGTNPEINSKADPNTGRTNLFSVAPGQVISNIDAGYIEPPVQLAIIGDYVWNDVNSNGIQDPGEPGLNGVTINLFDNTGELIGNTTTQNNPLNGLPGYYELTVSSGIYYLEFPTELSDGKVLTIKDAGANPEINSKADPNTGRTDLIAVTSGELITNIDAGYITPLIELSMIGDYVWDDLNRNGIQDAGEPGINGVLVNLYNSTGVLIESIRTEDNPATGLPGFYEFTVPAGVYFVEFPIRLENGQEITIQNAGTNPEINSKADPSTGRTNLFSLAPGQVISNIDAGYVSKIDNSTITKTIQRPCAYANDCVHYKIEFVNDSGSDIIDLVISDQFDDSNFCLSDTKVLINGQITTVTIEYDCYQHKYLFRFNQRIENGQLIVIYLTVLVECCICPGIYYNQACAQYGNQIKCSEFVPITILDSWC